MTSAALDPTHAESHHFLVLPAEVSGEDVAALAEAEFDDVTWLDPTQLQLTAEAQLAGPWLVDDEARRAFDLPGWAAHAFVVNCPVMRSEPVPPELLGTGDLLDAFPGGEPVGIEGRVVRHLLAQARRLGAALRCAGSGAVLVPDPATAIDLTMYTTVWLEPEACRELLRPVLGAVTGSWETPTDEEPAPPPDVDITPAALAQVEQARAALDPGEREWLHAEAQALDEEMLRHPQVLEGYAVVAELEDGVVQVAAAGEEYPPWILRHAPWAQHGVVSYEVRWYWHDDAPHRAGLAARRRRDEIRRLVESSAATLYDSTNGVIVDDDGFLVAREHLLP